MPRLAILSALLLSIAAPALADGHKPACAKYPPAIRSTQGDCED